MSAIMKQFYIDKNTGTFADELLAAGFIRVLRELYFQQGIQSPDIVQMDTGYAYEIICDPPLDLAKIEGSKRSFYPAVIIQTNKNQDQLPTHLPSTAFINYEAEKDKFRQYIEARKTLDKTAKRAEFDGESHPALESLPPAPHNDLNIFRMVNSPMAFPSYSKLTLQWFRVGEISQIGFVYQLICKAFSKSPNNFEQIQSIWVELDKEYKWGVMDTKGNITASQFFNPSQGKGVNRNQPDGVRLGNISNFWLLEWLKVVGFYEIGFTNILKSNDPKKTDRKTYVPVYGRMTPRFAQDVYRNFKHKMRFSETAVRSDILIVLRYLQAFLEKSEYTETESEEERWQREMLGDEYTPADFMRGFQVAFYKDLGNAVTTMNLSFLNLPGWVEIHQDDDVQVYKEILQEHEEIISRQLHEDRGEELDLLTSYRDFIVADHLDPFFEFTTAYSSWLISQGEKSTFPQRKLSIHNLRRLILSNQPNLSKILDSPGFINIARAIRESTIRAQYRKNQKNDKRYTVRYGLGRDLVRQSQYSDEFITALSEFLFAYNAENAQVLERYPKERYPQYKYRWDVQTKDIKDILKLADEYKNPNLIAKLLVAYGYASEYRAHQEDNQESTDYGS
jgi:DNA-dependent RNA polymerase auxiliary subunit epsilon